MSFLPLRDYIVIQKNDTPTQTPGGLYVPGNLEEKVVTGTVLAVGSGRISINGTVVPLEVKAGDQVAFNKNMATEVKVGSDVGLLLREDQVLCVIK